MDITGETTVRLQRIALQRLESLQRAGVSQLPRSQLTLPLLLAGDLQLESAVQLEGALPSPDPPRVAAPQFTPPTPPETSMAKRIESTPTSQEAALGDIRREVAACRRCEHLACTRTQTVFGVGTLKPRLCFFGEAPGADEDRTGEPFVGRAGQLLTDIIEKGMKLRRSDVYILNVLKCRPPDNRAPTDVEIANCREYFERQFAVLQPEFICCLGATATKALLNSTQSLGKMRGKWFEYCGARVIITYHPSYLLRNPPAKKDTWQDIQMLMRKMGLPIEKT